MYGKMATVTLITLLVLRISFAHSSHCKYIVTIQIRIIFEQFSSSRGMLFHQLDDLQTRYRKIPSCQHRSYTLYPHKLRIHWYLRKWERLGSRRLGTNTFG
jgi:hypothetical protein